MKYSTTTGILTEAKADCLIASLKQSQAVAKSHGAHRFFATATTDFEDKIGQILLVNLGKDSPVKRILLVGGLNGPVSEADFRKAAKAAADRLKTIKASRVLWALNGVSVQGHDAYWKASNSLTLLSSALYTFTEHKQNDTPKLSIRNVALHSDARSRASVARAVRHGQAESQGLDWARDLGNQPPNVCNPAYLLREARKLGRNPKVTVSSLDEKKMTDLGMGAFMAVSQGSDTPGRMIIIRYRGGKAADEPVVLIGKGITFDTGGISLKPAATMDEMKFDMCGAASVMGVTRAAIEARLPINLVTIVAAAENMPSGKATRPGDIVKTLSGKTVEILNTDAEGRLVLCDALSYAARYKPKAIIDVATLTGAVIVALGNHASAVYSTDDKLADALLEAGESSGDRAWRMPLWDEYQDALKSPFADLANIGSGGAGSVTAACFLSRFAGEQPWAHMDVAGSAFRGGASKGATGRPVSLLFRYLVDQS